MGTSVRLVSINSSERSREEIPTTKWLNWVLRKRRWRPSTSPSMSTTSREMAMLMPSTPEIFSVPATSTPHSKLFPRLEGDGNVDAFYAGDLLRACNLNPTLKTISEIGGESEKGKKMLKKAEVYPIYKAAKDSKDQGGFHDFVEILKLYDKNNDDTMMGFELFKLLTNLGEKLNKEEAKNLMKELCEPEDDDGFMPFKPFLERMCSNE